MIRFTMEGVARPLGAVAIATALTGGAQAALVPVYMTYHPTVIDYLYTTSEAERDFAVNVIGFWNYGTFFYLESEPVAGTAPLKRFYKGAPQYDHFYTVIPQDEAVVLSYGWVFEGVTGYIFSSQVTGSVPLFRLSHFNPTTYDLAHFYTTSVDQLNAFIAAGWQYDRGVPEGYVFNNPVPPNSAFAFHQVPATLKWNESGNVQIQVQNVGYGTWTTSTFGLASTDGNTDWNVTFVPLAVNTAPGGTAVFNFTIRMPLCSTPGSCGSSQQKDFSWRMSNGQSQFGPTFSVPLSLGGGSVTNNNPPGPPPAWAPTITTTNNPDF